MAWNSLIGRASPKQVRQRKLSWALKICMGFRASLHVIPRDIGYTNTMIRYLELVIDNLRAELRNIK
jgi:hypothetical protein